MNIADTVFVCLGLIIVVGALLAVTLKNVFHNALSLILSLFGVAGLFIYLNSEFLAVMEVIIYIGAISIAIIFAIMLSQPMFQKHERRNTSKTARALVIAAFLFIGMLFTLKSTRWPTVSPEGDYLLKAIGHMLLSPQVLPFEAVSLVLLLAIIGALLLSSMKEPLK